MKVNTNSQLISRFRIFLLIILLMLLQIQLGQNSVEVMQSSAILIEGPEHVEITGTNVNGFFGGTISNLGDFNGDGFTDFAITGATAGLSKVYIFFGKNQSTNSLSLTDANISFIEENANDFSTFGSGIPNPKITGVQDVNNDGYDDFIVSAKFYDNVTNGNEGIVYLILGSDTSWGLDISLSSANASFIGESVADNLSDSISGIGDTNGDNYDDFIIGSAWVANQSVIQAGKAYLFYGRASKDWVLGERVLNANASFVGGKIGDRTGIAVSGIGDVNNDLLSDFAIGSEGYDEFGVNNVGRVDIYYGNSNNIWKINQSVYLSNASVIGELDSVETSDFGSNIAGQFDFDNDGFDDLLIAATEYSLDTDGFEGRVYLLSGVGSSTWGQLMNISEVTNFYLTGGYEDELGTIMASLPDVNNDTYDDFIVGLPDYSISGGDSTNPSGKAHLFLGSQNLNQTFFLDSDRASMTFVGIPGERLGFSVQGIGDFNLDGTNNIALSGPLYGFSDQGRVYVIVGDLNRLKTKYLTETSVQSFTQTLTDTTTTTAISTEFSVEHSVEYSNITQTIDSDKFEFNFIWISVIAILIALSAIGIYFRSALLQKVRKE